MPLEKKCYIFLSLFKDKENIQCKMYLECTVKKLIK